MSISTNSSPRKNKKSWRFNPCEAMLKQRILTALVLLGILIPALFHPNAFWIALAGMVLVSAAAWEWGRLNQLGLLSALWMTAFCMVFCTLVWQLNLFNYFDRGFWLLLGGLWVLLAGFLLAGGVQRWSRIPFVLRWGVGIRPAFFGHDERGR